MSHKKRESSSISPLSPHFERSNQTETQLQQAHHDLARQRQTHQKTLEKERQEYKQRLRVQGIQKEHFLEFQQLDDYQSVLLEKPRQRDEELEAKEMEMDQLLHDLLQHQEEQNDSFLQEVGAHATGYDSDHEQDSREQYHVHGGSNSSVELNEMIEECQRELHEFGAELGLEQPEHVTMPTVPLEICTNRREQEHQEQYEQEYPYSSSMMVSSSVDLAQSLVRMLEEESLSNEEENVIWDKLATLSEQLYGKQDFYQHECHQNDAASTTMVPLEIYQRMESKYNALEQERTVLKQVFLQAVKGLRTAHDLQLQIKIVEIQEEAQRQVTSVLNGKQEASFSVDSSDDDKVIRFPVLESVRAPTTCTRDDYLSLPASERDLQTGGAWIMIPSDCNEDYSTLVYTDNVKCVHIGVFARESRLLLNDKESILVCSPKDGNFNQQSDVWHVTLEESVRKYQVPTNAKCVSDGNGGIWSLTPVEGKKELSFYNADSPSGAVVTTLPESSCLVMDPSGGAWVHVRKRDTAKMEPALYFYAIGVGHILISWIAQDSKCTTGADGICVLTTTGGEAQLTNVILGEDAQHVTLKNVTGSEDIRVIPREREEGDRALYVHCSVKNRWKLCLLDEMQSLSEICDCPQDARVVGDGKGGAWIFKRTDARDQMYMLTFLGSNGATREHGILFPPGCKIAAL